MSLIKVLRSRPELGHFGRSRFEGSSPDEKETSLKAILFLPSNIELSPSKNNNN